MTRRSPTGVLAACAWMVAVPAVAQDSDGRAELFAHSEEFRREVIRVTDGVYVAVGFALGNAILVEGDDGVIIIDTTEGTDAAREIKAEFDRITTKPVAAVVYTHSHPDHIRGTTVFVGDGTPEIYVHDSFLPENRPTQVGRGAREGGNQFGGALPDPVRPNAGIGPRLVLGGENGYMEPTVAFQGERYLFEAAGIQVELVHAPGETDDQIYVWLPERRILFPGDNFYRAFPNLYAIRGVPLRRVDWWVESLAKMIAEDPEYLVPSHTRPIVGNANVVAALQAYHDGVKSVFDQTMAGINRGLRPDELAEAVRLPEELAQNPYLREFYGTVEWSVRTIYSYHLGWFDGNATSLFPLSDDDRGARVVELAGGVVPLLAVGAAALGREDYQWAAEVADYVLAVDEENREARLLKAEALEALGEVQISANARNWYLTSAQWLREQAGPR
ncbi:MAG: alkyl/aryl-sulfatase [Gemmatimonadota bacterium]|nr:alkyl/aryl-sulfatase [Gemmatimonadota bacterium]